PLSDSLMQYITTVSPNYFKSFSAAHVQAVGPKSEQGPEFIDLYSTLNAQKNNLQLYTFLLKPSLAPVRGGQQSQPVDAPSTGDGRPSNGNTPVPSGNSTPLCW